MAPIVLLVQMSFHFCAYTVGTCSTAIIHVAKAVPDLLCPEGDKVHGLNFSTSKEQANHLGKVWISLIYKYAVHDLYAYL